MTIQSLAIALTDPVEASTSAWDELRTAAKQRPDHQALTTLYEPADQLSFLLPEKLKHFSTPDHFTWTYAQLVAGAEALATHFRKHGLKAGDRAAVFMLNGVDNVICMLACLRIGVTWATANPAFTKDKTHAIHVLETVHPQAVLVSSYEQASQLQAHGFPSGSKDDHTKFRLVCTQEKSPENFHWTTLRDLAQAHALDPASYENALAATVPEVPLQLVMFTSGTTNLPKACPHTAKMIRQILHVAKDYFGIHGNTRQLVPTPLFHGLGAWVCLFVIHRGGTICLTHKQFDPVSCLRSLGELKCTAFALAPSMVFSMTAQPGFNPGAYSHVETILLGSDYVSKHVVQLVKDKFRPQTVLNVWGMTEGTGCLLPPFKQPLVWDGELSYCGYVVPGGNIRICDIETGQAVRRGEVGELQMSGPTVIEGYFKNGTIFQNDCFCQDGDRTWFRTGDAALMKETGEVFIQSRYKDMIIRGGENMSPGYIENCIDGIDGVKVQMQPYESSQMIADLFVHRLKWLGLPMLLWANIPSL